MDGFSNPPYTDRGVISKKLTALVDWIQVTFQCSYERVISEVLGFNLMLMTYEQHGRFRYKGQYVFADIVLYVPPDDYAEMGYHLYLTGRACRQMELYLQTQKRTWNDFLQTCISLGGKFSRLDIAIDDRVTYFKIRDLYNKMLVGEYVSMSRQWSYIGGGNSNGSKRGETLNFGSRSSDIYIVFYEKNYEQAEKFNVDMDQLGDWNRYEIRLRKGKADECVKALLDYDSICHVAKSVLNNQLRFIVESETCKSNKRLWPLWQPWSDFIDDAEKIKLSMKPAQPKMEDKQYWVEKYVAPTLKMLQVVEQNTGISILPEMIRDAKLTKKHTSIVNDFLEHYFENERIRQLLEEEKNRVQSLGFDLISEEKYIRVPFRDEETE